MAVIFEIQFTNTITNVFDPSLPEKFECTNFELSAKRDTCALTVC